MNLNIPFIIIIGFGIFFLSCLEIFSSKKTIFYKGFIVSNLFFIVTPILFVAINGFTDQSYRYPNFSYNFIDLEDKKFSTGVLYINLTFLCMFIGVLFNFLNKNNYNNGSCYKVKFFRQELVKILLLFLFLIIFYLILYDGFDTFLNRKFYEDGYYLSTNSNIKKYLSIFLYIFTFVISSSLIKIFILKRRMFVFIFILIGFIFIAYLTHRRIYLLIFAIFLLLDLLSNYKYYSKMLRLFIFGLFLTLPILSTIFIYIRSNANIEDINILNIFLDSFEFINIAIFLNTIYYFDNFYYGLSFFITPLKLISIHIDHNTSQVLGNLLGDKVYSNFACLYPLEFYMNFGLLGCLLIIPLFNLISRIKSNKHDLIIFTFLTIMVRETFSTNLFYLLVLILFFLFASTLTKTFNLKKKYN